MNTKKNINGYWVISDIIDGYRVIRKYLYYTKKEAIKSFKKELKRS